MTSLVATPASISGSGAKNSDTRSRAGTKSTCSIIAAPYADMHHDFIISSFYLPYEVLTDKRYVIQPLRVITGSEFGSLLDKWLVEESKVLIGLEGAGPRLLRASKQVGISQRYDSVTDRTILICKIWYGEKK